MDVVTFYTALGWRVTSPYGPRKHPVTGEYKLHTGIDFGGKGAGTVIPTPTGGIVTFAKETGGWGNLVVVDDPTGHRHLFAHLSKIYSRQGGRAQRGDIIGTVGMTGTATGLHLHYQVNKPGTGVQAANTIGDPAKYTYQEDRMDKLIVIHTEADRGVGTLLEYKLKAPVITRESAPQELLDQAATVIQVGGPPVTCKGELIHLSGADRVETAWAVLEYIERRKP